MKYFLYALFFVITFSAHAQRTCGTTDYLRQRMTEDPQLESRMQLMNDRVRQKVEQRADGSQRDIIRIPVVVHVVYKLNPENISDAQIQSQIDVLNEDYRKLNADEVLVPSIFQEVAADCGIEFCLATRDPQGQATTGITRTATTVNSFSINDAVKRSVTGGKDAWPSDKYLNIWVCNMASPLLGFATLPGTVVPALDGVVICYKYFGRTGVAQAPYNKGRTATHEVGHWLNLLHIWGDDENAPDPCGGSDQVTDTPNQEDEHYNCPTFPQVSCSNTGDMSMNFMDYTDDACMYMFTLGQRDRMIASIEDTRSGLLSSSGCLPALAPSDCDTLNNIVGGDGLVYYFMSEVLAEETGYLTGTNSLGHRAFADQFSAPEEKIINGIRMDFAVGHLQNPNTLITANVWDDDGPNGSPGTVLGESTFLLADVIQNIDDFTYTDVFFPTPPAVTGTYYVGFVLNSAIGDTLVIYSNQIDKVNTNSGWFRDNTSTWYAYSDPEVYGQSLSLAIRPVMCVPVSASSVASEELLVYPIPGSVSVNVKSDQPVEQWQLIATDGRVVAQKQNTQLGNFDIDISALSPGIYFLKLEGNKQVRFARVLVAR